MRVQGCAHYCRSNNFFPANILTHLSLKLDERGNSPEEKKKVSAQDLSGWLYSKLLYYTNVCPFGSHPRLTAVPEA